MYSHTKCKLHESRGFSGLVTAESLAPETAFGTYNSLTKISFQLIT